MRLVLTHSGMHFAQNRQARYTPMPTTPPRLVISLLRAYPNGQDPSLRSGEKPHVLHFSIPGVFASLLPSTSSARLNPTAKPHRAIPHTRFLASIFLVDFILPACNTQGLLVCYQK